MCRAHNAHPLARWSAPEAERVLALASLLLEPVEENAILRRTVTALAAHGGFGFTRAFLFVADAERALLAGRFAVGPGDASEARRLDQAVGPNGDAATIEDLVATLRGLDDDALESSAPAATAQVRGLSLPLVPGLDPVLDACLGARAARFVAAGEPGGAVRPVWGERLA